MARETVRLGVNITADTADVIRRRKEASISATSTVHTAIALLGFVYDELDSGRKLWFMNDRGGIIKELIIE